VSSVAGAAADRDALALGASDGNLGNSGRIGLPDPGHPRSWCPVDRHGKSAKRAETRLTFASWSKTLSHFHQADDLGTGGAAVTLRVNAGHDPEYPLRSAGSAVGYYLQDGKEPPGQWAGKGAEALGLTGQVDPEAYRTCSAS
jgi:hypothetical protein